MSEKGSTPGEEKIHQVVLVEAAPKTDMGEPPVIDDNGELQR